MSKIKNGLVSLLAAGAIGLSASSCTTYFGGITPGVEIGKDTVEKKGTTYTAQDIELGDLRLYHLAFATTRGGIEHGFYRREGGSFRDIDPSFERPPFMKSKEQRNNKTGFYFLVPYENGEITLKEKLDVPESVSKEKTDILALGNEVHKSYALNELLENHRIHLPGDKRPHFVFPASEVAETLSTEENANNSPEYLPVFLVEIDSGVSLRVDTKTGRASFSNRNQKQKKIKVLKFFPEEEAIRKFNLGRSGR